MEDRLIKGVYEILPYYHVTFGGEVYSHRKLQVQVNLRDSSKSSDTVN